MLVFLAIRVKNSPVAGLSLLKNSKNLKKLILRVLSVNTKNCRTVASE